MEWNQNDYYKQRSKVSQSHALCLKPRRNFRPFGLLSAGFDSIYLLRAINFFIVQEGVNQCLFLLDNQRLEI